MNLNPFSWFRRVNRDGDRQAFAAGVAVARAEYRAVLTEDAIAASRRELEASIEAICDVNKIDTSDPAIAALIEAFKRGVVEQVSTHRRLMKQPILDDEERQEALSVPFESAESGEPSSSAQLPPPHQKALPSANGNGQAKSPAEAPKTSPPPHPPGKRRRGRPRKHPRPEEKGTSEGSSNS